MHPNPSERLPSDLIQRVLDTADALEGTTPISDAIRDVMLLWLRREGHLAIERAYHFVQSGVPEETAWFLAPDDMGFQLALAAVNAILDATN
jgi:hypothetical protein